MRSVFQSLDALGGIPGQPVVDRLPRHRIAGGNLRLRRPAQALHHSMEPLLQHAQLRKSHPVPLTPEYRRNETRQDTAYNQPPHPSFFIGDGMTAPTLPTATSARKEGHLLNQHPT